MVNIDPEEAEEIAASLYQLRKRLREQVRTINGVTDETRRLKELIGQKVEQKTKESWLIKAGVALILFPDPTITDLVGGCLIATGILTNRNRQFTAADVCKEFRKTMKNFASTSSRLTL